MKYFSVKVTIEFTNGVEQNIDEFRDEALSYVQHFVTIANDHTLLEAIITDVEHSND